MPYRRKSFRRRRYPKRRFFRKGFRSFARRVYKAMAYKSEKKYSDIDTGNVTLQSAGVLLRPWQTIAGGSGKNQRIGNKIRARFLKIALTFNSNGIGSTVIRFSVVRARTAGLLIGDCPVGSENQNWDLDKWHVMSDMRFDLGSADTDAQNVRNITRTVKIMQELQYDNATAAPPIHNEVMLFFWANDAIIPSPFMYGMVTPTWNDL